MDEIDEEFYCSLEKCKLPKIIEGNCFALISPDRKERICSNAHRKHPTPEQFKEEYGDEWKGAVYSKCGISNCTENCNNVWILYPDEKEALVDICVIGAEEADPIFVCACTPFGKPDGNWRPE